jgi:hypothetical protein
MRWLGGNDLPVSNESKYPALQQRDSKIASFHPPELPEKNLCECSKEDSFNLAHRPKIPPANDEARAIRTRIQGWGSAVRPPRHSNI